MEHTWDAARRAFADASVWFAATVARIDERWNRSALGDWTVLGLVGHTAHGLMLWQTALRRPAEMVAIDSVAGYFRAARSVDQSVIAEAGRQIGTALGADPVAAVAQLVERVTPLLEARASDEMLVTVLGGMRLGDYLATRVFELTVHTTDLAAALDLPLDVPATAARLSLRVVADLAADTRLAGPLLLAATGRGPLPDGFCVL